MELPYIDPIALQLGPLAIRWYGLSWMAGVLLILWGGSRRVRRIGWSSSQAENLVLMGFVGAFLGGRLGYVLFYNLPFYLDHPANILRIWDGGMSFHGGLLGCAMAIALWAWRNGKSLLLCFDMAALWLPLCIFTVRMGNFLNAELWGRPTDLPWGMIFWTDSEGLVRHPSQLYEALCEGLLLFLLVQMADKRFGPPGGRPGMISGVFLSGYALARLGLEFVRQPDAHIGFDFLGWITRGQLLTLPLLIAGLVVIALAMTRAPVVAEVPAKTPKKPTKRPAKRKKR